jgi:UDP-N-acetylglucosamine diphosphorylase / glucose-1-phosphate thymidylyltransferase / UDP-N-acetylgalactosamine diphosphorylase / glucosamine-1-phosphate N-acetyltransferase / galactosamine-1-phosphate N-acetyltransferase
MQAVILAAGLGTRLRPVTGRRSKAMVPVVGRPLVEWALAPIVEVGIREAVMVVAPGDEDLRRHFEDRSKLRIPVQWVVQNERLGMAHALGLAAPLLRGKFIVSACDSLVSASHLRELLTAACDADAVLSLLDVEPELVPRSAAVELDGCEIRRIVEKPGPGEAPSSTISLPHYVFSTGLLAELPHVPPSVRGEYELQTAIQAHIDGGARVVGVRADERFQVSTPEDLLALSCRLMSGNIVPSAVRAALGSGCRTIDPVVIEAGAAVGAGCTIGPEVYLEAGSSIGDRAVIRRSIVLEGGRVGEGETVVDAVVVD